MAAAADIRPLSLPSTPRVNNEAELTHKNDNACQTDKSEYNNQPEIYNNNQEQPNEQQIT